ncbi:hypothetical protein BA895_13580 [Humibacillus sp. DSM 29435]|uniref:hypothetical protein n=1 Tax=Humibacillus sp. DSM 29435 TaxID=1869167 RepID=UPI0008732AE7|nr:hypothetical protein [Humibacillus sp. DSM 29435]OFE17833.1 hypothetical protein BA895_13580 [Humibacillus sp. DSM 29435]
MNTDVTITGLNGLEILDSRGRPSLQLTATHDGLGNRVTGETLTSTEPSVGDDICPTDVDTIRRAPDDGVAANCGLSYGRPQ